MFDPTHLSFTGTLQRGDGRVLIVRKTLSPTELRVWEHPFHGSPRPAEPLLVAVRRCVERDLGVLASAIKPLLPTLTNYGHFGDTAPSAADPVEAHPSYLVVSDELPRFPQDLDVTWILPAELGASARRNPREFHPILTAHAACLPFFGGTLDAQYTLADIKERATG